MRYTSKTVEVFYHGKRVASHIRSHEQGGHTTCKEHMPEKHRQYMEWTPSRIIHWAGTVGDATSKVVETIMNKRRHPEQGYRSCFGIIQLGKRYTNERLEAACQRAIRIGGCSYKSISSILKSGLDKEPLPDSRINEPILHNNIRGCGYYQ